MSRPRKVRERIKRVRTMITPQSLPSLYSNTVDIRTNEYGYDDVVGKLEEYIPVCGGIDGIVRGKKESNNGYEAGIWTTMELIRKRAIYEYCHPKRGKDMGNRAVSVSF